jgi:hypothetical protein
MKMFLCLTLLQLELAEEGKIAGIGTINPGKIYPS